MNPLIQLKTTPPLLITLMLLCFALLPKVQAVGPDTDGNIPGANNGEGVGVLVSRTTGIWNTGTGFEALNHLTGGNQNTATGLRALFSDINGGFNTATGVYALFTNTTGFFNSATGAYSLTRNTTGNHNSANGYGALYFNTEGVFNTATGSAALYKNTTGFANTATGSQALNENTTGNFNTANGYFALPSNTTGGFNTAIGTQAGAFITTGDDNTCLGANTCHNTTTANNVVCVGSGADGENISNRAYIPNIGQFAQASGGGVEFVTVRLSDGKLGHSLSSRRYKMDIKSMGDASELIYKLKPVTYRVKKSIENTNENLDYGLIAEDVAELNPELAIRDGKGQIESLRYMAIYNMMLNEFIKARRQIDAQQKQIDALTAGLQKVSVQLEASKPAPQVVNNNQ